jgi:hypothetical protein
MFFLDPYSGMNRVQEGQLSRIIHQRGTIFQPRDMLCALPKLATGVRLPFRRAMVLASCPSSRQEQIFRDSMSVPQLSIQTCGAAAGIKIGLAGSHRQFALCTAAFMSASSTS